MDSAFTEKLGAWLSTEPAQRDPEQGVTLLLRLSGNIIEYRNLMKNPASKMEYIESRLQKYYNFRVQELTHEQVADMERQVAEVVRRNIPLAAKADSSQKGKRADHDSLPEEVQELYRENLTLLHRIRELHLQLRKLSQASQTCPDSERYPFLKELIAADKKMRSNWEKYDYYITPSS